MNLENVHHHYWLPAIGDTLNYTRIVFNFGFSRLFSVSNWSVQMNTKFLIQILSSHFYFETSIDVVRHLHIVHWILCVCVFLKRHPSITVIIWNQLVRSNEIERFSIFVSVSSLQWAMSYFVFDFNYYKCYSTHFTHHKRTILTKIWSFAMNTINVDK